MKKPPGRCRKLTVLRVWELDKYNIRRGNTRMLVVPMKKLEAMFGVTYNIIHDAWHRRNAYKDFPSPNQQTTKENTCNATPD